MAEDAQVRGWNDIGLHPPKEHREKRCHWVRRVGRDGINEYAILAWVTSLGSVYWEDFGTTVHKSPKAIWDDGWSYLVPCIPPVEAKEQTAKDHLLSELSGLLADDMINCTVSSSAGFVEGPSEAGWRNFMPTHQNTITINVLKPKDFPKDKPHSPVNLPTRDNVEVIETQVNELEKQFAARLETETADFAAYQALMKRIEVGANNTAGLVNDVDRLARRVKTLEQYIAMIPQESAASIAIKMANFYDGYPDKYGWGHEQVNEFKKICADYRAAKTREKAGA